MSTFTLKLCLGNELMQTPEHIADALRRCAKEVTIADAAGDGDSIRDLNGNTVGRWELEA